MAAATKEKPKTSAKGLPFGLKPWQVGVALVTLVVVGYYLYKHRNTGAAQAATSPSPAVDASGATSGQPPENAVPPPSVTYNIYPPDGATGATPWDTSWVNWPTSSLSRPQGLAAQYSWYGSQPGHKPSEHYVGLHGL